MVAAPDEHQRFQRLGIRGSRGTCAQKNHESDESDESLHEWVLVTSHTLPFGGLIHNHQLIVS
jgi:hypothetical protein